MKNEQGFTLIELLSVIAIIGVLAGLGVSSLTIYQANAAYAVAGDTMRNARTAFEAGINDIDNPPPSVALITQTSQGSLSDASAAQILRGMMLPKNIEFRVQYDSNCLNAGCQSAMIEVSHCRADEHLRWVRFGDGMGVLLENLAGGGC